MADITIYDPEDLDDAERARVAEYADLPEAEFDEAVTAFIAHPDGSTRRVLFCAGLAQDTMEALGRLHAAAVRAEAALQPKSDARRNQITRTKLIAAMRDDLRPYLNLAIAAAADQGTRRRAERVLGKARYGELRQVMRDLDAGMDETAAVAAYRARQPGGQAAAG